jgi:hypothetical protein
MTRRKEHFMKISMLIGLMTLGAGVAGMSNAAHAESGRAGRWQGSLLRDGRQVAIALELDPANPASGALQVGGSSAPLQAVRTSLTAIHFEVAGEGVFDGTIAGDSMAGSVSGHAAGSFALARETQSPFGDAITSSGP